MADTGITVKPVNDKSGRARFVAVPHAIYRNDPNWVPQLNLERMMHLSPTTNPYFKHAEAQLFVVEKNGAAVGRISAQINQLHLDQHNDATGNFGFIEAPDDRHVFNALLSEAEGWLKARGMKRVTGPFSFSINDETGLLISGFDKPPNIMMGHAHHYYAGHIEAAGYSKVKDVIAYFLNDKGELPRHMKATFERAMRSPDLKVRSINKRDLDNELNIILSIHTDAWSENWGFVPFTKEEIRDLGNVMKWLIKEGFVAIAEYQGEPVAMAVTLPNINDWIKDLGGRLTPIGISKLLWRLTTQVPKSIRMPLMGVRKRYHGSLLGSSLALAVIETVRKFHIERGTQSGELSWILEDNYPVRHIIEALGADAYKTYRVYEKSLA